METLPSVAVPGYKFKELLYGKNIWTAIECDSGREVVIKVVDISNKIKRAEFDEETEIWNICEHQSIITAIQIYEYSKQATIIMEKVNSTLTAVIETHPNGVTFSFARSIFYQLCVVVKFLHSKNVAHLNLNPQHILLEANGRNTKIQLTDFSSATIFQPGINIMRSCGKDFYRAPEIESKKSFDPVLADIWSLGIILHAMLTGKLPFNGFDCNEALKNAKRGNLDICENLPQTQYDLIRSILEIYPNARPSIDDILSDSWVKLGKETKRILAKSESEIPQTSSPKVKIKRQNSLRRLIKKVSSSSLL